MCCLTKGLACHENSIFQKTSYLRCSLSLSLELAKKLLDCIQWPLLVSENVSGVCMECRSVPGNVLEEMGLPGNQEELLRWGAHPHTRGGKAC